MQIFDIVIIGGGPAGLSAAIYSSRYNRSTLVINRGIGRIDSKEVNENYLGFPEGLPARFLYTLGQKQAERFGSVFAADEIVDIKKEKEKFIAVGKRGEYAGKALILATGVTDIFPDFINSNEYLGKSLFWCITCDGYKARNKKVIIIGKDNHAAVVAKQFLNYTSQISFVSNCSGKDFVLSQKQRKELQDAGITVYHSVVKSMKGQNGVIEEITLESGKTLPADFIFSETPARPNNDLAKKLGVSVDENGYITTSIEQRTNLPFVYAAGDITKQFAHQIVTAAAEGATAGMSANYDLYRPEQKE